MKMKLYKEHVVIIISVIISIIVVSWGVYMNFGPGAHQPATVDGKVPHPLKINNLSDDRKENNSNEQN